MLSEAMRKMRLAACFGLYGWGVGYMLPEEPAYCARCPVQEACWERFRASVQEEHPLEVEDWMTVVANVARKKRISMQAASDWAKSERLKFGAPDPFSRAMFHNMDNGMTQRQRDEPETTDQPVFSPGPIADVSQRPRN